MLLSQRSNRLMRAGLMLAVLGLAVSAASAAIYVKIPNIEGDCKVPGYEKWIVVDSVSYGVEREMQDSGKAGTEDINIGVGELQEVSLSKSMDSASGALFHRAIAGNSVGEIEIHFVETTAAGPTAYRIIKLDTALVKSWSTSGDADDRPTEDVTLRFHRIATRDRWTPDGRRWTLGNTYGWDSVANTTWRTQIEFPK